MSLKKMAEIISEYKSEYTGGKNEGRTVPTAQSTKGALNALF